MVNTLLVDINALLALGYPRHPDNAKVEAWIRSLPPGTKLLTCSITELGFLRVSLQAKLADDIIEARAILAGLLRSRRFVRVIDDLGASNLPAYITGPKQITDAHLVTLAHRHHANLATLDTAIPHAEVIA